MTWWPYYGEEIIVEIVWWLMEEMMMILYWYCIVLLSIIDDIIIVTYCEWLTLFKWPYCRNMTIDSINEEVLRDMKWWPSYYYILVLYREIIILWQWCIGYWWRRGNDWLMIWERKTLIVWLLVKPMTMTWWYEMIQYYYDYDLVEWLVMIGNDSIVFDVDLEWGGRLFCWCWWLVFLLL